MSRSASLLAVLVVAKTLTLAAHGVPWSFAAPFAYFWQDVLAALVFFMLDLVLKRPWLAWVLYAITVGYVAINVPVTFVLSTPLTWTLIRAAGGPLSDSIGRYVTAVNLGAVAIVAAAGTIVPRLLASRTITLGWRAAALATGFVAVGPFAASRVDTHGLHRNALGALLATTLPRVLPLQSTADWRRSPLGATVGEDLTRFRGSAAGRRVVVVILESTAASYLGLYGAAQDPMPTLTALAQHGLVFERAYAVYPESIKGLFATLCSRYPAFDTPPEVYASVPCASLAGRLRAAGYRTALFHSGRFEYLGMRSVIDNRGFEVLEDAGAIGGQVHSSFGVDEPSTVARMLGWIDSLHGERFFLTYLPIAGHHPYASTRTGPFSGATDFGRYLNALYEGDEALGALLRGLHARHLDDDTLVVVLGDHGEAFGQHDGNFAHTLHIYEENVHVPFVIAAGGAIGNSIRVSRVASVVDTAPTILELLGLPRPAGYQGASLLGPESRMALFYTDYSLGWLGLADSCWTYLYQIDSGRSRLFDVCKDPAELHDRSSEHDAQVRGYRETLEAWAAAQKEAVTRNR